MGAVDGVGQGAVPVDLHDLDVRPGPGQALADQGVLLLAPATGLLYDEVELAGETTVPGGGRGAALEAERRHGHLPPVVHTADDVLLRTADVGEEDLVEVGRAIDLGDGAHLDPGLAHGNEEVGDAGVLGASGSVRANKKM